MVELGKQVGEEQRGQLAHEDVAELLGHGHLGADLLGHPLHDVGQGEDVRVELGVGRLVQLVEDLLDVGHGVGVGDHVEGDRHRRVDEDPLQGLDVSGNESGEVVSLPV